MAAPDPNQPTDSLAIDASTLFVTHGVVEHGDHRGRTIGFPTANLPFETNDRFDGVWAAWVDTDGERHLAAVSIGHRPTFYGTSGFRLLEAHVIDFEGDLYSRTITVALWHRIRDQVRFESVEQLVDQLRNDVAKCRQLARYRPGLVDLVLDVDKSRAGFATLVGSLT